MASSSDNNPPLAAWSPARLLEHQLMNAFSGLVAQWVQAQTDSARIENLLDVLTRYREDGALVDRHDTSSEEAIKQIVAAECQVDDPHLWGLLLSDHTTGPALLENRHLTADHHRQISQILYQGILGDHPEISPNRAAGLLQDLLDRNLPCHPDVRNELKERAFSATDVEGGWPSIDSEDIDSLVFHTVLHDLDLTSSELEKLYARLDPWQACFLLPTLIQHPGANPTFWKKLARDKEEFDSIIQQKLASAFYVRPESWQLPEVRQLLRASDSLDVKVDVLPHSKSRERARSIAEMLEAHSHDRVLRCLKARQSVLEALEPGDFSLALKEASSAQREKLIRALPGLTPSDVSPPSR